MKNTAFLIFFIFIVIGCDPIYNTTFNIKNNTNDTISLFFYSNDSITLEKKIAPSNSYLLLQDKGMAGSPTKISLASDDSILVYKKEKIIKFYRDSTSMNDIYVPSNWSEVRLKKYNYEYTYSFSENDFK